MKIAIVGLGYVGAVTGTVLADMQHEVLMVDRDAAKVKLLNEAKSPIAEPGLSQLLQSAVSSDKLRATENISEALQDADLVVISVGTPTDVNTMAPDLSAVLRVSEQIAISLKSRSKKLLIAVSSTVPPQTTEKLVRPILTQNGSGDDDFALAFIPEFLREGSAIEDFRNPTRFIVGARSTAEAELFAVMRPDVQERHFFVQTEVAEMLKTTENAWHATKITFANEIGRIAESAGVDAQAVMSLLLADNKQNVSATYLRPGFAYGGSCLPKDLNSLLYLAKNQGVETPMLSGVPRSNLLHVEDAVERVLKIGKLKVGILGLAFKADTDDIRSSPSVDLAEALLGKGFDVKIHDFESLKHQLYGSNESTWQRHSHLATKMVGTVEELFEESEIVILAQYNRKYLASIAELAGGVVFLDLTGLTNTSK